MQNATTRPSRALAIVAAALTSVQLVAVTAAFVGLLVVMVGGAPEMWTASQELRRTSGLAGIFAGLALFVIAIFAVLAIALLVGLGYMIALLGIAAVSIFRGRGERLKHAAIINAVVAITWLTAAGWCANSGLLEGLGIFGALFVVAAAAAACCAFAPRDASLRAQ